MNVIPIHPFLKKEKEMNKKLLSLPIAISSLLFLANCDMFKSNDKKPEGATTPQTAAKASETAKTGVGEILLYIGDKAAVTANEFEEYMESVMEAQPQFKQLMAFMPDAEYELFNQMKGELAIQSWVESNKIDQRADYKKEREGALKLLDRQLAQKYFQQEYPVKVTESDARKFYDENKDKYRELMVSPGGVNAEAVFFEKEDLANAFATKVKEAGVDFAKTAKDQSLKLKEFKQVTSESFDVEAPVRDKIIAMKKFPSIDTIKVKTGVWVVKAKNKDERKYVPFDQVKEGLMNHLKTQRIFTDELDKLKEKFNFKENKDYFDRKKAAREQEMKKMMEEQQQAKGSTTADAAPNAPKQVQTTPVMGA